MAYENSKIALFLKDAEPMAGRFTPDLKGLIAWLETQDGATEYDRASITDCMICQFVSAITGRSLGYHKSLLFLGEAFDASAPMRRISRQQPWTFGAALSRARARNEAV